jgi:type VI secretion system protein ImpB
MAKESAQHGLDRKNKPRVHITYDVEKDGAIEERELPFVVGVLADLSGERSGSLPDLKKRGFVDVDRKTFDKFLKEQKPRVAFKVVNHLTDDKDAQLSVDVTFESMKDFEPDGLVQKVPELKKLVDLRNHLKSLQSQAVSSDEVAEFLKRVLTDEGLRQALARELGVDGTTKD